MKEIKDEEIKLRAGNRGRGKEREREREGWER